MRILEHKLAVFSGTEKFAQTLAHAHLLFDHLTNECCAGSGHGPGRRARANLYLDLIAS